MSPDSSSSPSVSASMSSAPSSSNATNSTSPIVFSAPSSSPDATMSLPSLLSPVPIIVPSDTNNVYECSNGTVVHAGQIANDTTLINLSVAYAAAINGSDIFDAAMNDLESVLLQSAIAAALNCDNILDSRRLRKEEKRSLSASTDTLGNCNISMTKSTCFVLESDLAFIINDIVNPQYSAYIAYLAIQQGMDTGTFIKNLDDFIALTYLAPLPLFPPVNNTQPLDAFHNHSRNDGNATKSWTIGACITMSTGGFIVLVAWFYSSRLRNKGKVEIPDEPSLSVVSVFSAEHGCANNT
eukprot:CAMPEP_0178910716 /NCGR_PEP_ID=MMETSP0786-20121207/9251_1 /TAXON_ID=186022 /ORGANISM="Thalassionema frauenfeldii, Strain CCMP 1798" /LENGTH=296 /DNA_ID=CAMNT_0020582997 /DNA_START=462 /DNA_END=1352 /DNA_ORIENTATION=-